MKVKKSWNKNRFQAQIMKSLNENKMKIRDWNRGSPLNEMKMKRNNKEKRNTNEVNERKILLNSL